MIENKIEILSDKEHVLKRPDMYIGTTTKEEHQRFMFGQYGGVTYVAGLLKLIEEIVDNSVDEAIRTDFKFANKISVDIELSNNTVTVVDNGRGIPQDIVVTPEGEEIPGPVAAWTKVRAGGNFGDDKERVTGGKNGVGSSLTNIFSVRFIGITSDGKNELTVSCSNNADNVSWKSNKSDYKGTKVEFIPDFSHFSVYQFDKIYQDIISDQLQTLAVMYPKIEFKFNGKKVQSNFKKYVKQFDEFAIFQEQENCKIAFARSPDGFRHISYANSIHTKNGGTHIDCVIDDVCDNLIPSIKKKHGIDVTKSRIKECLTLIIFVSGMKNMRFDSQTKERLTSPNGEVKNHLQLDVDKISSSIMKCDELLMPIIEAALARKLAAEQAALTKANKKAQKAFVAKHVAPINYGKPNTGTELFIAEGDSAIGFLLTTRNKQIHGGFPLRGKILNTWNKPQAEQMKNKEIFEMVSILGLDFNGGLYDGEGIFILKYDYINIFCDNDHDGRGSIYPSLLAFFSQWPELFKEERIRWVKTPIIIASKNEDEYEDTKWFYSLEEYDKAKKTLGKYTYIRYIKGLGSLVESEYSRVVNNPSLETVILDEGWKDKFDMLFTQGGKGNAAKRREWLGEYVGDVDDEEINSEENDD